MKTRQPNLVSSRDVRNRQGEASTICLLLPFNTFSICSVANQPKLAKSDLSAFTADSLDQENKMQCI